MPTQFPEYAADSEVPLTDGRWRTIEREIDVTHAAGFVEIGLAFEGEGTAWLDDVELSID